MCRLRLVDHEENDLTTQENMPWSFRFHPDLKSAITKAAKAAGLSRAEWVARACSEKADIEYTPNPSGRRWPQTVETKKPARKRK